MVLLRVQLKELLHTDVGKAERVGPVPLVAGGVDLNKRGMTMSSQGTHLGSTHWPQSLYETHPDSFHHEADVANAHEVGPLIDGIDGLDMTGDLKERVLVFKLFYIMFCWL